MADAVKEQYAALVRDQFPPDPPDEWGENARPINRRYNLRDAAYALEHHEDPEEVIEKMISRGSVSVLVGKFGSKKTWFAVYLAVCVALCKEFLGLAVKGCTVLFIDEESGEARLSKRIAMAIRGALGDESAQLKFVSLAQFNFLKRPNDVTIVKALIEETGAQLVIIDALADIMAGGDENAVKDTQPVFMALRNLAETTGAAIVVIHHVGKGGDYRGSSAIPGALDNMFLIESKEGSPFINLKSLKRRDGEPVEFSARATWNEDQFYLEEAETPKNNTLNNCERFVLDTIKTMGEASISNVVEHAGDLYERSYIQRTFRQLIADDLLMRTDAGGKGVAGTYSLKTISES